MQPSGGYRPALDGLRAVAIAAVVLFHDVVTWVPGGYIGVDVFFVLSGYLITGILLRETDLRGGVSFRNFYVRRALRLFPALLLLAGLLITAYLLLLDGADRRESVIAALAAVTYTSSPLAAAGYPLGSMLHAWSLSVEEYFYVVWPAVVVLVARARRHRLAIVAGITVAAVAYRLGAALAGWDLERIYYAADTRAEQLLIGSLLAVVLARGTLPVRAWHGVVAAAALLAFAVTPADLTAPLYRYGGSTLVALAAATLVVLVVQRPDGAAARLLSTAPFTWVGKRSYGIYLWNPPIAALVGFALPQQVPALPVVLVLTVVIPALSYRFVEEPFLRMKDRFTTSGR